MLARQKRQGLNTLKPEGFQAFHSSMRNTLQYFLGLALCISRGPDQAFQRELRAILKTKKREEEKRCSLEGLLYIRASLYNWQHLEGNLQMPRVQPGQSGDADWLSYLGPNSLSYSVFQIFQIFFFFFFDPPWETELHRVFGKVCTGSMVWREIVAVGRSVHPTEKNTVFQLKVNHHANFWYRPPQHS